uniref:Uncharacterized protein n=1 Tax=Utricularia reniformis TaxID=192314 RepID=A0A1Y0B373_9LAMI|nr:hypothetical protein AEK19_MT1665 [Utricularia reniformis]ART31848.1 hypothetical protein AEK19_MT1665 [Utricularia reniformis]
MYGIERVFGTSVRILILAYPDSELRTVYGVALIPRLDFKEFNTLGMWERKIVVISHSGIESSEVTISVVSMK